jgi:hypothetical protein
MPPLLGTPTMATGDGYVSNGRRWVARGVYPILDDQITGPSSTLRVIFCDANRLASSEHEQANESGS